MDLDFDAEFEDDLLVALGALGYAVETDWRPNRVELAADGSRWVDLHPLVIDADGNARQADLNGGWHEFDKSLFTTGSLDGNPVPCVSAEAQRLFHLGYELREVDHRDLAVLDQLAKYTSAHAAMSAVRTSALKPRGQLGAGALVLGTGGATS